MDFRKGFVKKEVFDLAFKSDWNSVHIFFWMNRWTNEWTDINEKTDKAYKI